MTVLVNPSRDPAFNLAAEEFLLSERTDGDFLMLWINDPAVIIGKFQNPWVEVSLNACEERGIPIVRRNSGGGCVYHDPGNLNYTILTDRGGEVNYERFLTPVVEALRKLGVPAEITQTSTIEANGFKLSGNAQSNSKSRVLHHGTLLFDADLAVLGQLTGHAKEEFASKSIESNPSPVGNIRPLLRDDMSLSGFAAFLENELAGDGAPRVSFTEEEIRAIRTLADEKYRTWEWNFGKTSAFTARSESFEFRVEHGIIVRFDRIRNDCLADVSPASDNPEEHQTLEGQRFMPEPIRRILGEEAVRELF